MSATMQVVDAYLRGEVDSLRSLEAGRRSHGLLGRAIQALAAGLELRAGCADRAACLDLIDKALRRPPRAADVHICLLDAALHAQPMTLSTEGLSHIYQRMLDCLPQAASINTRFLVYQTGLQLAVGDHDLLAAQQRAREALDDHALDPSSKLHVKWRQKLLELAIANHDFNDIESRLEHLEKICGENTPRFSYKLRLEAYFQLGQPEDILSHLAQFGDRSSKTWATEGFYHAAALMDCGRYDEAQPLIASLIDRSSHDAARSRDQALVKTLHLRQAILKHDWQEVQALLQRPPYPNTDARQPMGFEGLLEQLLFIALWAGWQDQAESLLLRLDRHLNRGDLHLEWARLHLLQGDEQQAAARFACLLSKKRPRLIESRLRMAPELQGWQVARLFHMAHQPLASRPTPTPVRPLVADARSLVGQSASMEALRQQITLYAPLQQPVLIIGETGTGKELVARELHRQGPHADSPFLAINCAAIPDSLAEAELFGHLRGTFTGAVADRTGLLSTVGQGSLLLDEVNSLSLRLQALLLRVLETGDYLQIGGRSPQRTQAHFIFASNQRLEPLVEAGTFRRDFYYRLQGFTLHLPPLRERREDIADLCRHLMDCSGGHEVQLDPTLLEIFQAYPWPGNVRELRNEIERMVILRGNRRVLTRADCRLIPPKPNDTDAQTPDPLASAETTPQLPEQPLDIPGHPRARTRRRKILALLGDTQRLYREDVIHNIGCAPNTATADLAALEEAGFIQRICTSNNLRTSYFVRQRDKQA